MIPLRDSIPSQSKPVVTMLIIAINVMVFLHQLTLDPYSLNEHFLAWGMVPAHFSVVSLFTGIFIHGGWMHLIGNMWFLWIYGDNIEDILGPAKYVLFYLSCGVAASLAQYAINPGSEVPNVGASGAIAGVMGAYLLKFPHARIVMLVPLVVFITTIEIPAVFVLILWFVMQFFSGFGSLASRYSDQGGVAFFAHIGGFLAGMALIYLFRPRQRYWRRDDYHW
jgi:membrane associated rhomboid family serine protease